MAVGLSCQFHSLACKTYQHPNAKSRPSMFCSMQPPQNNIKVIINGAAKEIGRAAVIAVTRARGMEVAGAVDSYLVGEDIGKVCDMEEPLEIPITNDLTMVLGSISQSKALGVVVDFTEPSKVYDNVKQGCLVAPTLSIGSILLQQDAISASFHYNNVEIVESRATATDFPSSDATQIANNLSNLGQIYNREDISTDVQARGQVLGEDGVRVHSLVLPGLPASTTVYFSRLGEVYSLKHDITDVQCLMPGLLLAIRKIVRIKEFHSLLLGQSPSVPLQPIHRWIAPRDGFAKVNVGGMWLAADRCGGIGVVIRNESGSVLAACSKKLRNIGSLDHLHAVSLLAGIRLAVELNLQRVCFECGSAKLAIAVSQDTSVASSGGVLIDDCCVLLSHFQSSSVANVPRLCNRVANRLALFAFHLHQDCFWFGEAPELVQELLTQDCCLS